jgi:hypothetical protein
VRPIIWKLNIQLQDYLEVCWESTKKVGKVARRSRFGKTGVEGRTPCYTLPAGCGLNCSPASPAHRFESR